MIGAGKSTASLVKYLLDKSNTEKLQIRLADKNKSAALKLIDGHPNGDALEFDVFDANQRANEIQKADIVVSMLPARFHVEVAKDCLRFEKNMVTASYVSDEMQALHEAVEAKGLLFLNEMGVDPGIDHMSAMQVIDRIKSKGGKMILFESFTGGLVAPESDDNLWQYKFTWNPRNVVTAGQGGAARSWRIGKRAAESRPESRAADTLSGGALRRSTSANRRRRARRRDKRPKSKALRSPHAVS